MKVLKACFLCIFLFLNIYHYNVQTDYSDLILKHSVYGEINGSVVFWSINYDLLLDSRIKHLTFGTGIGYSQRFYPGVSYKLIHPKITAYYNIKRFYFGGGLICPMGEHRWVSYLHPELTYSDIVWDI